MKPIRVMMALLTVGVLGACSAAAAGHGFDERSGVFTREIGPATISAVERQVLPILQRFGYEIERTETAHNRFQLWTLWQTHDPYPDEQEMGVARARTRVIIETRPRATTSSSGETLSGVLIRLEAQHMDDESGSWRPAMSSEHLAARFREIAEAFRLELQVKAM